MRKETEEAKDPKQRIMEASMSLFARKGYAAASVRDIAGKADVNVSMISYYFQGKMGVLKTIVEEFYDKYTEMVSLTRDESGSPEECVRVTVQRLVEFVRRNTEMTMTVYNSLPFDISGITELRARKVAKLAAEFAGLAKRLGIDPTNPIQMAVVGPSLITMIVTLFRYESVQKRVYNAKFDDAYYERLADTISTLFLDGVHGIVTEQRKSEGKGHNEGTT